MNRLVLACAAGVMLTATKLPAIDWSDPGSVVEAALAVSPSLHEIEATLAAAKARQISAGTLPNPMLMAGVRDQQIDLSLDRMMTMYMVGASQTFVPRQRREAERQLSLFEVQRLEHESESRRAAIRRDVLVAWDEAAAAQNQIAASEEIMRLATMIADAARIRYEVGAAPQIDIIRARLEASNVRHEILMQKGVRDQAEARLRALLQIPAGEVLPPFTLGHDMEHQHQADVAALDLSTPAVAALEAEASGADEEIRLARLARKPDLNLELSYGYRPQEKDMFSLIGRIELPIRKSTTIAPRIAEAEARGAAARARIEALKQQLRAAFGEALVQRTEAVDQINLHVEELVPEAKLAFESALASYQAGKTMFDSVLEALKTYRMLNVDYYSFLRQLEISEAEIEAMRHGAMGKSSMASAAGGAL